MYVFLEAIILYHVLRMTCIQYEYVGVVMKQLQLYKHNMMSVVHPCALMCVVHHIPFTLVLAKMCNRQSARNSSIMQPEVAGGARDVGQVSGSVFQAEVC